MDKDVIRKELADYAHNAWSGWMKYLFEKSVHNEDGTVTIPAWAVSRWNLQVITKYKDLPEEMKKSDLDEADEMLKIMGVINGKEEISNKRKDS